MLPEEQERARANLPPAGSPQGKNCGSGKNCRFPKLKSCNEHSNKNWSAATAPVCPGFLSDTIESVLEKVRAAMARYGMAAGHERIGVAVSGGIDSVTLLDVLTLLHPALAVIHLNHRLRGAESDEDERFVAALAQSRNLPFHSRSVELPPGNMEQEGRKARRALFGDLRDQGAVDRIALGHTRSDQAETVLYRLLRGSGTAGMSGILPITAEGIIRPLIDCSRAEVSEWASERNLKWREDRTNADPSYARNRIRHRVLPMLAEEFGGAVPDILAATAALARDEENFWAHHTATLSAELLTEKAGAILFRTDRLLQLHPAVGRRLLRKAVKTVKGNLRDVDLTHIEGLIQLAAEREGHGRIQLPGLDVFRSFEWMRIARPRTASRFQLDYRYRVEGSACYEIRGCNSAICLEIRAVGDSEHYNETGDEGDWDRLRSPIELRNWHPGDEFHPPGRSRRKIKVLFQEARIPIWERHSWPVLTSAGEIVWTRGFGISEGFLPQTDTRTILRVHEREPYAPAAEQVTAVSDESDEAV